MIGRSRHLAWQRNSWLIAALAVFAAFTGAVQGKRRFIADRIAFLETQPIIRGT